MFPNTNPPIPSNSTSSVIGTGITLTSSFMAAGLSPFAKVWTILVAAVTESWLTSLPRFLNIFSADGVSTVSPSFASGPDVGVQFWDL